MIKNRLIRRLNKHIPTDYGIDDDDRVHGKWIWQPSTTIFSRIYETSKEKKN